MRQIDDHEVFLFAIISMPMIHSDAWKVITWGGCALCQAQEKTEAVLVSVVMAELQTTNNHAQ